VNAEATPRLPGDEAVRSGGRLPRAPGRVRPDRRPPLWHAAVEAVARTYFESSYGLLAGTEAGRRLLRDSSDGDQPVHGYFTRDDREALLADLDPGPGDRLLDLGSGMGGVAIDVHRRTGAEIVGVDLAPRAVAAATRRATRAGLDDDVTFVAGTIARPPRVGATHAYAIDSLMFLPDPLGAVRGLEAVLEPGGCLFATMLVVGPGGLERFRDSLHALGVRVERLDDVTAALEVRSRARAGAARALLRRRTTSFRGRLGMLLVIGEESFMRVLIAAGMVARWRFVVCFA
jgi:SAM-dependent methyltransferase